MMIVKNPEGFTYTTTRICEHCNAEKATICLQYVSTDIAHEKLSPNRYYCEFCWKADK